MRTRYFRDEKGRFGIKALVFEQSEHGIPKKAMDVDACKICRRLKEEGHEAYIIGGAVRDFLIGRIPKDFDIATDATPSRVKKLFRNSRVIGKRFRLVHIFFQGDRTYEVATFRALESGDRNHVYGSLHQDAKRRDFTLNALYYDPDEQTIVDFVGGIRDIRKGVIRSVLPLKTSFIEDPVRMLRAVKYAAVSDMRITGGVSRRIQKDSHLLAHASVSRLSEELYKVLKTGKAEKIFRMMDIYGLLMPLLPRFFKFFTAPGGNVLKEATFSNLAVLDRAVMAGEEDRGVMLRYLTEVLLEAMGIFNKERRIGVFLGDLMRDLKSLLHPLSQPNRDVEEALRIMFRERRYKLPRKRPHHHSQIRPGERGVGRANHQIHRGGRKQHSRPSSVRSEHSGRDGERRS